MASSVQVLPLLTANQSLGFDVADWQLSVERIAMQTSHRLAAIAMFALLAAWGLIYQNQQTPWATAAAFIASDLGFCTAIVARLVIRRPNREATSLFIVQLVLMAMSLQTMLFTRMDLIRSTITTFFASN